MSLARKAFPVLFLGVLVLAVSCNSGSRTKTNPAGTPPPPPGTQTITANFTVATTSVTTTDQLVQSTQLVAFVFSLAHTNGAAAVTVDTINVANSGSIDESIFTNGAQIFEDTNADELPDGTAFGTAVATTDNGTFTFNLTGLSLTSGAAARTFLVVVDGSVVTAAPGLVGQTLVMSIAAPGDILTTPGGLTSVGTPTFGTPNPATVSVGTGANLVINEINYDDPGMDINEFIEIYNPTGAPVVLTNIDVYYVTMTGASYAPGTPINLGAAGTLPSGGYLVITDAAATLGITAGPNLLIVSPGGNTVQNGGDDGILLVENVGNTTIDTVIYEATAVPLTTTGIPGNPTFGEGAVPGAPADTNTGTATDSIGRNAVGADTNDNSVDWVVIDPFTPGTANP